jgi:hypothetical protein
VSYREFALAQFEDMRLGGSSNGKWDLEIALRNPSEGESI